MPTAAEARKAKMGEKLKKLEAKRATIDAKIAKVKQQIADEKG